MLQVNQALHRLAVHAVETGPLLAAPGHVQQAPGLVALTQHTQHMGHRIAQHAVGKGLAAGQSGQVLAANVRRLLNPVHHRQQHRLHGVDMGPHRRVAAGLATRQAQLRQGVPGASGQRAGPQCHHLQHGPLAQQLGRQGGKPARQQAHAALLQKQGRMLGQQCGGMRQVTALDGMVNRRHGTALRLVPARGRQVQPRQLVGALTQQLGAQEVGKQAVVAPFALDLRLWGVWRRV